MLAQVSLYSAPARSGIVCTPVPGTWPEQDWRWPRILRFGSFSSSLITCLGPVPMKFVLLGDPAMRRPGFSDCGATVTHRNCTGVSPSMNYLCSIIYAVCAARRLVSHRVNKQNNRGNRFFSLQIGCAQISCRALQLKGKISVERGAGERCGVSQACRGRDSLSGGSEIAHKKGVQ